MSPLVVYTKNTLDVQFVPGDHICGRHTAQTNAGDVITVQCQQGTQGKVVVIRYTGLYAITLTLCRVDIYGSMYAL